MLCPAVSARGLQRVSTQRILLTSVHCQRCPVRLPASLCSAGPPGLTLPSPSLILQTLPFHSDASGFGAAASGLRKPAPSTQLCMTFLCSFWSLGIFYLFKPLLGVLRGEGQGAWFPGKSPQSLKLGRCAVGGGDWGCFCAPDETSPTAHLHLAWGPLDTNPSGAGTPGSLGMGGGGMWAWGSGCSLMTSVMGIPGSL